MDDFRLGSDPENLFSFAMMQKHLQKFARLGLILTSVTVPILTSNAANTSNMNWDDMCDNFMQNQQIPSNIYTDSVESIEKFNKRMRDIVIDMIRLEYI